MPSRSQHSTLIFFNSVLLFTILKQDYFNRLYYVTDKTLTNIWQSSEMTLRKILCKIFWWKNSKKKKKIMKQSWCNFVGNLKKWCILALYQHNHWVRVRHIDVNEITGIGSDYVLAPGGAKPGIFLVRPLGKIFSEILIEIHIFILNDVWKMVNSVAKVLFLIARNQNQRNHV